MRNIYSNIKASHLIIAIVLILFLINFNFYNHIYLKLKNDIYKEEVELSNLTGTIKALINKFNNNQQLFNKITLLENKIMENEYEIGYLKNKNKTRKDIINIFQDIASKSNVNISKIELISEKSEKETGEILFKFIGSSSIDNFLSFLDIIENEQEFLTIQSYKLDNIKKDSDIYNIEMILKFVYIIS